MHATKDAIDAVLDRHAPRDAPLSLREIYALVATHVALDDEDRMSDGFLQTRWQRNVRNVLQLRKQARALTWVERGRYMLPPEDGVESLGMPA